MKLRLECMFWDVSSHYSVTPNMQKSENYEKKCLVHWSFLVSDPFYFHNTFFPTSRKKTSSNKHCKCMQISAYLPRQCIICISENISGICITKNCNSSSTQWSGGVIFVVRYLVLQTGLVLLLVVYLTEVYRSVCHTDCKCLNVFIARACFTPADHISSFVLLMISVSLMNWSLVKYLTLYSS